MLVTVVEATARHKAEVALGERVDDELRQSEARLRALAEASSEALYRMGPDWAEMRELAGGGFVADTASPSRSWLMAYIPPEDQALVTAAIDEAIRTKSVFELEHRVRRVDGSIGRTFSRAVPILGSDGEILEWFGSACDVTERQEAEARQALLAREVDHRARNALAIVQAIVRLSRAEGPNDYRAAIEGRVAALARAHGLLAKGRWMGGDLRSLADAELAPYLGGADGRTTLTGPPVDLAPEAVQAVSMILHELATNAAKYGALSVPDGRVEVTWTLDGDGVRLDWRESDGPPVAGAPARGGFGSRMIQASAAQLGGKANFRWSKIGLRCVLALPPGAVAAGRDMPRVAQLPEPATRAGALVGRRVLLVEDEPLLAEAARHVLEELGCVVVGPAGTLGEALKLAADEPHLDGAVLDVNLRGREVWPAAEILASRGVPHLFLTGYDEDVVSRDALVLQKPVSAERLVAALAGIMGAPATAESQDRRSAS